MRSPQLNAARRPGRPSHARAKCEGKCRARECCAPAGQPRLRRLTTREASGCHAVTTAIARWVLPWAGVLAFSTGLTGATCLAAQAVASPPGKGRPAFVQMDNPPSSQACDPSSARLVLYAVSNGWLSDRFRQYCRERIATGG